MEIVIRLNDEQIWVVNYWASRQGITPEEFIASYVAYYIQFLSQQIPSNIIYEPVSGGVPDESKKSLEEAQDSNPPSGEE